jgi:hypothetical protein
MEVGYAASIHRTYLELRGRGRCRVHCRFHIHGANRLLQVRYRLRQHLVEPVLYCLAYFTDFGIGKLTDNPQLIDLNIPEVRKRPSKRSIFYSLRVFEVSQLTANATAERSGSTDPAHSMFEQLACMHQGSAPHSLPKDSPIRPACVECHPHRRA